MYSRQAAVMRKEKLERLALIKQRHRELIVESRESVHADVGADLDAFDVDFELEMDLN